MSHVTTAIIKISALALTLVTAAANAQAVRTEKTCRWNWPTS